jgi:hypothetical protein
MDQNSVAKGYLKFFGPSVKEGRMNAEKAGSAMIALSKMFQKYQKSHNRNDIELKLGDVRKNCTETIYFFEHIAPAVQTVAEPISIYVVAKAIGVTEFTKEFFSTLGKRAGLAIFSKGKPEVVKELIQDEKHCIKIKNPEGKIMVFEKETYDSQKIFSDLDKLVQLEEGKEDKMEIGYYDEFDKPIKVAEIKWSEKNFFKSEAPEDDLIERLGEDFDDDKAKEEKIIGVFVDYYVLAHKYNFSFQARKDQDKIGKQKILCIVKDDQVSKCIDLLKPENQGKNICIFGQATKNREGKIDKMKISDFSLKEDFDPNQMNLL